MKVNQSPNALKVQCQNHGQETVIDCIKVYMYDNINRLFTYPCVAGTCC